MAKRQHRKPRPEELPPLPVVEDQVQPEVEERELAVVLSLDRLRLRRGRPVQPFGG
ncbi:hypothetical protein ACIRD3_39760 [Kitasatospora sp. NPDC093550]|uniref:hypothetical protein n=1 Tax=Kitasatospora sp. NPDC093550 TaxID=3364089 RepID=UPI0038280E48